MGRHGERPHPDLSPEGEEGAAAPGRSRGALIALVAFLALAMAGFATLGAWQVHRLAWKRDLLARVAQHHDAAPVPAPDAGQWPALALQADEYRRVSVRGQFHPEKNVLVRASTQLGTGHWVLTPLRSDAGFWVWVNRGFTPSERDLHGEALPPVQEVEGLLRFSEPGGSLLQANDPAQARWYSRDVAAATAARGLPAGLTAPYFIDAAARPDSAGAWPRPGLTVLRFSDNHLVYALTWFALAAMACGAIAYIVVDHRRHGRHAGERLAHPGD
jgi:surfeit locus 1 family protein